MGVKEAENPLQDDEEEEKKTDEWLLGTAFSLLDDEGGATLDDLLRPYEAAEKELMMSEHGDAASSRAEADRRLFVRRCAGVQALFLREKLPGWPWPWRPSDQERRRSMDPSARAEKGLQCAKAFRSWMGSYRNAEAAREEDAGPGPGRGAGGSGA